MDGQSIRTFFRELFGSRLAEQMSSEIARLTEELQRIRDERETTVLRVTMDNQQLRTDKDAVIADLRNEKTLLASKLAIYELSIQQRVGIDPSRTSAKKPSFATFSSPPTMTRWQQYQQEYETAVDKEENEVEAQKIAAAKLAAKE
jgi:hypothetical protein